MSTTGEPPHRAQIRIAMTVSGLMMAHQVAGKATRDAIFLSQFKITALPTMMATAALAAVSLENLQQLEPQRVARARDSL
jgi:hypothetical protein